MGWALRLCRVGFACRYQRYDIPIGAGRFSFALSDVGGLSFVSGASRRELKDVSLSNARLCCCALGRRFRASRKARRGLWLACLG